MDEALPRLVFFSIYSTYTVYGFSGFRMTFPNILDLNSLIDDTMPPTPGVNEHPGGRRSVCVCSLIGVLEPGAVIAAALFGHPIFHIMDARLGFAILTKPAIAQFHDIF